MTRAELEHLIRAAADICNDDEIVIIGSQAILGQFPNAPETLRVSIEADLFPLHYPERADLIDGTIGELSPFHATYGYYGHGVAETTAMLPAGWRDRLVLVSNANTRWARGLCLEVHDLLISKLAAGRERDCEFLREVVAHGLVSEAVLLERLALTPCDHKQRERMAARIRSCFRASR